MKKHLALLDIKGTQIKTTITLSSIRMAKIEKSQTPDSNNVSEHVCVFFFWTAFYFYFYFL